MPKSELRQDIVSGDWILLAPDRGKRPQQFINKSKPKPISKKNCIFEHPEKAGGGFPIIISPPKESPWVQVVPNRFPAVTHESIMSVVAKQGPFFVIPGVGHHDLVITRDHYKNFPKLPPKDAKLVLEVFQRRYKMLADDPYVSYISIFHNYGPRAGASIYHPHYQIITLPIVPPFVQHSLDGSEKYYRDNKHCVFCTMLSWEKKQKKRVIYENKGAIAFAPFVSHFPFEINVFPKKHSPFFEDADSNSLGFVADALQKSLKKIEHKLNKPDYNFYLHTAPTVNKNKSGHYHWHIEVQPRVTTEGGFESDTKVEINVVDPDVAAKFLRS